MPKPVKPNHKIVLLLLLLGALPALPAVYILNVLLQGAPSGGTEDSFIAAHHFAMPLPLILHGIGGIAFAALMPFQFSNKMRQRWPRRHRASGRVVFTAGLFMAFSALFIINYFPIRGGVLKYSVMLVTAIGMIVALGLAVRKIRLRDISQHRAWMMRAVAITYGGSTAGVFGIPLFLIFGDFGGNVDAILRWGGLMVNVVIVEYILCSEKTKKLNNFSRLQIN